MVGETECCKNNDCQQIYIFCQKDGKIDNSNQFHQQFMGWYSWAKKLQSQKVTREKPCKTLLYKKNYAKRLLKLTLRVDFINKHNLIFCTEEPCAAFLYLPLGFKKFCWKDIGKKSASKMLLKLTQGVNFINVKSENFTYESTFRQLFLLTCNCQKDVRTKKCK